MAYGVDRTEYGMQGEIGASRADIQGCDGQHVFTRAEQAHFVRDIEALGGSRVVASRRKGVQPGFIARRVHGSHTRSVQVGGETVVIVDLQDE